MCMVVALKGAAKIPDDHPTPAEAAVELTVGSIPNHGEIADDQAA